MGGRRSYVPLTTECSRGRNSSGLQEAMRATVIVTGVTGFRAQARPIWKKSRTPLAHETQLS
jgi:hypothetical protein